MSGYRLKEWGCPHDERYYVDTMSGRDIVRKCSDDTYLTSGEIVGLLNGMLERIRVLEDELSVLRD